MIHNYYIEFRFHGYPKKYIRELIDNVSRDFKVRGAIKNKPVPHMTLFGPFQTTEPQSVFSKIERVCKTYRLVPFVMQNFDKHDSQEGKVIAVGIKASPELVNLRRDLARELSEICISKKPWDKQNDYWFHSTIAMKDIDHKFNRIWAYVNKKEQPCVNQHLVRITLLNGERRIEREYDLILQRWLNRNDALNRHLFQKTIDKLQELKGLPPEKKQSLFERFRKMFGF
ncbi:2'-5' RNA ligase family protein [Dehalococcoides mccartyi]|uniref:2'-5' RNA ligase family protein n=1 Tax=Dehalococcoides mccartyi TaxID=61435 RepID=UPI00107E6C85|nr:2'-5' RNA ligase family protein [Dehalococcoides mccartyi]QBX63341.1 hypothetical protein DhcFL2_00795 [Dehalococcoides mccartyi]